MAKTSLKVKGLDEYLKKISNLNGDLNKAVENALIETHDLVTQQIRDALGKGVPKKSGGKSKPIEMQSGKEMEKSFYDKPEVNWFGMKAITRTGFNQEISQHAVYMMITGTAHTEPSRDLYNAIYGAATKKKIKEIQEAAFQKAIEEAMR